MAELRYVRAIAAALGDALAEDEKVIVFGEDVSAAGGAFGASRGLRDRFGAERVRDTPLSEAAIVGAAVGAPLSVDAPEPMPGSFERAAGSLRRLVAGD